MVLPYSPADLSKTHCLLPMTNKIRNNLQHRAMSDCCFFKGRSGRLVYYWCKALKVGLCATSGRIARYKALRNLLLPRFDILVCPLNFPELCSRNESPAKFTSCWGWLYLVISPTSVKNEATVTVPNPLIAFISLAPGIVSASVSNSWSNCSLKKI